MYVLTGSHNLLLMQSIGQSLAGRTALLTLAPFSVVELRSANLLPQTTNEMLFKGCFPRIYDKQIEVKTYGCLIRYFGKKNVWTKGLA